MMCSSYLQPLIFQWVPKSIVPSAYLQEWLKKKKKRKRKTSGTVGLPYIKETAVKLQKDKSIEKNTIKLSNSMFSST
jgi:hypothetical protein